MAGFLVDRFSDDRVKEENPMYSYSCVCGSLALVLDRPIEKLPLRPRDGARVIDSLKHNHKKFCSSEVETVHIRRKEGVERQYRFKCITCALPVFYRHDGRVEVTFVLKEAVVRSKWSNLLATDHGQASTCVVHNNIDAEESRVVVVRLGNDRTELNADIIKYSCKRNYQVVNMLLSKTSENVKKFKPDRSTPDADDKKKNRGTLIPK